MCGDLGTKPDQPASNAGRIRLATPPLNIRRYTLHNPSIGYPAHSLTTAKLRSLDLPPNLLEQFVTGSFDRCAIRIQLWNEDFGIFCTYGSEYRNVGGNPEIQKIQNHRVPPFMDGLVQSFFLWEHAQSFAFLLQPNGLPL